MKINITGHHLEVTDAIRAHVEDKMQRVKRHFDKPIEVNVTVAVEKQAQKIDLHLHALNHDFHVSKSEDELYAAIDAAVDVLDRKIRQYKEKLHDGRRHDKSARE